MKLLAKLCCAALALLVTHVAAAQNPDTYTLTVCGDGSTLEEATTNALREAVGQAYGVYVSSDTAILNDEIVRDEIGALSSGNILDYKQLAHTTTPQGGHMVTLQATVSITNLTSFSKAKGSKVEFAGALFGANMRLIESAKKNERIVIDHFIKQVEIFLDHCGPFSTPKLLESNPKKQYYGNFYDINIKYCLIQTAAPAELFTMVYDFLSSIALTDAEVEMYKQVGERRYRVACSMGWGYSGANHIGSSYNGEKDYFSLRTPQFTKLCSLLNSITDLYTIVAKDSEGKVVATQKQRKNNSNVQAECTNRDPEWISFPYWWRKTDDGKLLSTRLYHKDTKDGKPLSFSPARGDGYSGLTMEQVSRIASIEMEHRLVYQKVSK